MPFADELIGADTARTLHAVIRSVAPGADLAALARAPERLGPLPLRARADLLRDALLAGVPGDHAALARVIRAAAADEDFTGWLIWPVTTAVAARAVEDGSTAAFDDGMSLLAELTGRLTAEFALRTFLRRDPDRALAGALAWTGSDDPAVRRLASEGARPYLPWAVRVPAILGTPGVTLPILDRLYRDPSEDVRRSVANHLNDLSRDAPDLVVATARRWSAAPTADTGRVVRHALRTLLKRGDPGALELLGFGPVSLDVAGPTTDRASVATGGAIRFRARIRNIGDGPARLAIDYVVHHRKANGAVRGKTFKLTERALAPGEAVAIDREHSFRPIATRRYYPGGHRIELQINGKTYGSVDFDLTAEDLSRR